MAPSLETFILMPLYCFISNERQKCLQTNTNIVCRWVPNTNTLFYLSPSSPPRYFWPDAQQSRWSYNKYGLIKLDRVTVLGHGSFFNMKVLCLSYLWSKIKSRSPAFLSIPFHNSRATMGKTRLTKHRSVYLHTIINRFHLWVQIQQTVILYTCYWNQQSHQNLCLFPNQGFLKAHRLPRSCQLPKNGISQGQK